MQGQNNSSHPYASALNGTYFEEYFLPPVSLSGGDIIALILLSATFVLGVVGNSWVIYVFGFKNRGKRQRFEAFLLLLAMVDWSASALIPLSFMYLTITGMRSWHFGRFGCKVLPSLLQISITVSHGILILISWERYQALVHPFEARLKKRQVLAWISFVFAIALALVAPYMYTLEVISNTKYHTQTCLPNTEKLSILMGFASLALFRDVVAMTIMVVVGYRMNKSLSERWNGCQYDRKAFSARGRRMLRIVILVFILLTLPVDIFQVGVYGIFMTDAGHSLSRDTYRFISVTNTFLNILQTSNSITNVFIYSRMHSMFRENACCAKRVAEETRDAEVISALVKAAKRNLHGPLLTVEDVRNLNFVPLSYYSSVLATQESVSPRCSPCRIVNKNRKCSFDFSDSVME